MNYLDDRDYEDVSFIKKHPEIKGVIITLACIVIFMIGASFTKLTTPKPKEEVNTINVEIEKKGKLIVAETEAHDTDVATSQAMVGPVPLWYDNSVEYDCYAKSTVTYDLDQTKATANTLTKVVTVKAPKQEVETHLMLDTYKSIKENQTIFNPVDDKDLNKSQRELQERLNDAAMKSKLPQEAETSFEEHMTKWITDQDAYKDYTVKFKYA